MNIEQANASFGRIEEDLYIQNLIAQANARYILLNTSENKENFPRYTIKDEKLNILALYYLDLGCTFAEAQNLEKARGPLEKAALILEYVHAAESNKKEQSNYFGLIASLAYYVAFQYSKSYILIQKLETNTVIANLISRFLRRNFQELTEQINKIVIDETYKDEYLSAHAGEVDGDTKVYEITIAKALNNFVQYLYTGNEVYLDTAKSNLSILKEIAELKSDPGIWWVIRLLILITGGFKEASLWDVLKNYFDINSEPVKKYILSLVFSQPRGIYELFITQRKSLPKVLDAQHDGSVISVPTSSGKTRIAEIAIFNCLNGNQGSKVLYLAPFRSLAYEIENTLDKTLHNSNITVSQLYGGGLFSKLDESIIENSDVIIATPEKSKAMLRANAEILDAIKLVVVDEGHLFGGNKRLIVNEIFYEELKYFINKNNGKFLLLSAVLPNADEIANWLTDSTETVYKDTWRPSDERFGTLEWTGRAVNLHWHNSDAERATFNNNFIVPIPQPLKPRERVVKHFPGDKNEAISATARKLRKLGTVLIFVGRKASVFTMAKAYLKTLDNPHIDFQWNNQNDWKAFELACKEIYGDDCEWLIYARKGILCHNSNLHADVRLPLERLMRNEKPEVIIATSTLAQGVNLGISTVIFSTLHQNRGNITSRDFWNIAGRAGRAFIDHEGKVLVAIDISDNTTRAQQRKTRALRLTIDEYFDKSKIAQVESGILILLRLLKQMAISKGITFDLLLELITENRTQELGDDARVYDETLDWLDDSLLALQEIHNTEQEIDYTWIEDFFRKSLAYIQTTNNPNITGEEVVMLLKARIQGIINKVGTDKLKWKSLVTSGIPLQSSLFIENNINTIKQSIEEYLATEKTITDKISLLKNIEIILKEIPVLKQEELVIDPDELDSTRTCWLSGRLVSQLPEYEKAIEFIAKYYSYLIPWLLNAVAKKLKILELNDNATILEELSILSELGLPNLISVKIYQTGIRSRAAAQELSALFDIAEWNTKTIKQFKEEITDNKELYKLQVSASTSDWIELLSNFSSYKKKEVDRISSFKIDSEIKTGILVAQEINGRQYLVSPDLSYFKDMSESNINFSSVNNIDGVYFTFNPFDEIWEMQIHNPYITVRNN